MTLGLVWYRNPTDNIGTTTYWNSQAVYSAACFCIFWETCLGEVSPDFQVTFFLAIAWGPPSTWRILQITPHRLSNWCWSHHTGIPCYKLVAFRVGVLCSLLKMIQQWFVTGWIRGESHLTVNDLIPEGIQALVSAKWFTCILRPSSQQKCESWFRPMKRLQRRFDDSDNSPVSHNSVPKFDIRLLFGSTPWIMRETPTLNAPIVKNGIMEEKHEQMCTEQQFSCY